MLNILLLNKSHNRKHFDCGNIALNSFLQKTARQHITKGMSRTFVLINSDNPKEIIGFHTLSICEVESEYLPTNISNKYPDQVPAVKLARLAVSIKYQNLGYGNYLISSAVDKTILISENVGIIGLFIDAKDESSKKYYQQYGFIQLKRNSQTLFIPLQTLVQYK
jgi:predicted N-acetyltransferase YhbS